MGILFTILIIILLVLIARDVTHIVLIKWYKNRFLERSFIFRLFDEYINDTENDGENFTSEDQIETDFDFWLEKKYPSIYQELKLYEELFIKEKDESKPLFTNYMNNIVIKASHYGISSSKMFHLEVWFIDHYPDDFEKIMRR